MDGFDPWSAGAWLLESHARTAALLLLALALATLLRRHEASARRHLWCIALLGALALPALAAIVPSWDILPRWPQHAAATTPAGSESLRSAPVDDAIASVGAVVDAEEGIAVSEPAFVLETSESLALPGLASLGGIAPSESLAERGAPLDALSVAGLLLAAWAAVALALLLRIAMSWLRTARLARRATSLSSDGWSGLAASIARDLGIRRPVRILVSREANAPGTWGWVRPVVVLPEGAEAWSAERRRVVLLHELLHVRRADWVLLMLARVACALYWALPLAWLALRRLELERERACDEGVVAAGMRPSSYADHLLAIARGLAGGAPAPATALAMVHRSSLEKRLMSILHASPSSARKGTAAAPLLVGLGLLVVALAALGARQAAAQEPGGAATPAPPSPPVWRTMPTPPLPAAPPGALAPAAPGLQGIPTRAVPSDLAPEAIPAIPPLPSWDFAPMPPMAPVPSQDPLTAPSRRARTFSSTTDDDGASFSMSLPSHAQVDADGASLRGLAAGDWATFEEERDGRRLRLEISQGPGGSVEHIWFVDGRLREFDGEARDWMHRALRRTAELRARSAERSRGAYEVHEKARLERDRAAAVRSDALRVRDEFERLRRDEMDLREKIESLHMHQRELHASREPAHHSDDPGSMDRLRKRNAEIDHAIEDVAEEIHRAEADLDRLTTTRAKRDRELAPRARSTGGGAAVSPAGGGATTAVGGTGVRSAESPRSLELEARIRALEEQIEELRAGARSGSDRPSNRVSR